MAIFSVLSVSQLEVGRILAPERYHPSRRVTGATFSDCIRLGDLVSLGAEIVTPSSAIKKGLLVLDTGNAKDGFIPGSLLGVEAEFSSHKKRLQVGDVIISRLRPYLRQVGYIDYALAERHPMILASTEFYVLRSVNLKNTAFLVPYLLSELAQRVFASAVEGGHHPRFHSSVLLELPIPKQLVDNSEQISKAVDGCYESYRAAERIFKGSYQQVSDILKASGSSLSV